MHLRLHQMGRLEACRTILEVWIVSLRLQEFGLVEASIGLDFRRVIVLTLGPRVSGQRAVYLVELGGVHGFRREIYFCDLEMK